MATNPPLETRDWMRPREVAKALGVHENTIRNWMDSGRLKFDYMPGPSGYRRIPKTAVIMAFMKQIEYFGPTP